MLNETVLRREFSFLGVKLVDPNSTMSPEEVRQFYSTQFPDLTTASITGPEVDGDKLKYNFVRAIGAKG